jgi:tripartite-type tricarboxylate transporter receptor subunit TctC
MKRIVFLTLLLLSGACIAAYPNGPLKMIVPFPAGGPTDVIARLISNKLGEALGQPVYVENKAGAHGAIGLQAALAAPADGQTVAMVSIGTNGINPVLYKKSSYDVNKDFVPVSLLVTVPIVIVTKVDTPFNDLAGMIAYAKANPGKLTFASAGSGGSSHLVPEMFMLRSGVDMVHVPYKGTAPAISDVLAGQVNLMFDTLLTSTQHIQSGKLKVIASTTIKRLPDYPKVPTVAESGYPGFEASSWYGLEVRTGTPPEIVRRLSTELAKIMKMPDVKERLDQLSTFAVGSSPDEFAKFQKAEQEKWGKVIQKGNIQPD